MSGLPFGPLKEVFQVVEERSRYGKTLTTITAFAIIITVILVCLALCVGIIGKTLVFFGIVSWPSLPVGPLLAGFHWEDILIFAVAVGFTIVWSYGTYRQSNYFRDQHRRQIEREESVVALLTEIRDKLPQPASPPSSRRP